MVLRKLGRQCTKEQIHSMISSVDTDGNGKISLDEFTNMLIG